LSDRIEDVLAKVREITRKTIADPEAELDYSKLARLLCHTSQSNTYIIDSEGRILGYGWISEYNCPIMFKLLEKGQMPADYVGRLNRLKETLVEDKSNSNCAYGDFPCKYRDKSTIYVPIFGKGERLGSLILARFGRPFDAADVLLGEHMSTLVGIEILHERHKRSEEEAREKLTVQMALKALSYSEMTSMKAIIGELKGDSGIIVASKVADQVGVTRSVIVNALRKLESAGLIESRSLGMKGTHIKITARSLVKEIESL